MSGPAAAGAAPAGKARPLSQIYRDLGESEAAESSPLYGRIAVALSESAEALRAVEAAPVRKRHPALILAALHDLALAGRAPALAEAYEAAVSAEVGEERGRGEVAVATALDTLCRMTDEVVALAVRRRLPPRHRETGHCAVLYPAIAEAAHRCGARAVGLIDVGCSAGLNLNVDRVGIAYSNGQALGDLSSPVRISASVVGERPLPTRKFPQVVARIGIDREPLDVTGAEDARWLRACLPPDQLRLPERGGRLDAEMELVSTAPPLLLRGDPVTLLSDALARVPADALPVVVSTWELSRFSHERRLRFVRRLEEAAAERAVAWVPVEGVGVAPHIPTLGDRPASGHSTIGLAMFERSVADPPYVSPTAEALGRCWSRGRLLSWLVDSR
ncbi:DUF2332 domain-containing protein [Streptomyces sp. ODS28]|uniref:DUF2332 domain-containing protein n=1 Tax=Streptomyces sp. ODS28 TaxID=3136688 RepID=UPI0031EF3AB2